MISEYLTSPQKRVLDLSLGSTIGGVALLGGAVTGVFIGVSNEINPVFTHKRVGARGELFSVLKLRTMDDEKVLFKSGQRVRDLGLDETPQFINVLLGKMSIVGYRPLIDMDINHAAQRLRDHFPANSPYYPDRWLSLREQGSKPGITGPAQTMPLRPDAGSIEHLCDVITVECNYLETATMSTDIVYILRTPRALREGHNPTVLRAA